MKNLLLFGDLKLNYQDLLTVLFKNSDEKYNSFNSKLLNTGVKTIGCRVPVLRKLAKLFTWEEVIDLPENEYYETDLLKGIVLSGASLPFDKKTRILSEFILSIENWAVCDCSVVKVPNDEKDNYFEFFSSLLSSDKQFVCRYGIVNLLSNYLDDVYICRVFESLKQIKIWGEYYVDVAVAWLTATAMAFCRNQTVEFMQNDARQIFNVFSYNKALQKMRESFRVSETDKQWTYSMKIVKKK